MLVFDSIALHEEPVRVGPQEYVLREATGDVAIKYRNRAAQAAKFIDGKMVGVGNVAETEAYLVSLCLFLDGKNVPESVIRSWKSKIQKALYNRIVEVSDLQERGSEEQQELSKLLTIPGAPCSLSDLRTFLDGQEGFSKLKSWLRLTPEEASKNV